MKDCKELPPGVRPLEWSDYSWLHSRWQKLIETYELKASEYSASNVLLFAKHHHYCLLEENLSFVIEPLQDRCRLIPTCFPLASTLSFFEEKLGKPCTLYPIPDSLLPQFPETEYVWSWNEAESDYLYQTEILKSLPGRGLSSRRNLLHQLMSKHEIQVEILTLQNRKDASAILEEWQMHHQEKYPLSETDASSCKEALSRFEQLPLKGRIAYIEGKPVGFFLGERFSKTTYLLHFLKTLSSIHGLSTFLYVTCAQHDAANLPWINLESDLGLPALKQAKQAYLPDHLLLKWDVKKKID